MKKDVFPCGTTIMKLHALLQQHGQWHQLDQFFRIPRVPKSTLYINLGQTSTNL